MDNQKTVVSQHSINRRTNRHSKKITRTKNNGRLNTLLNVRSCFLVFILFIMPMKAFSQNNISDFQVTFKLSIKSKTYGNATLGKFANVFTKTETGYNVKTVTKTQGIAAIILGSNEQQTCDFSYDSNNNKATPTSYSGGTLKKEKYRVNFDWEKRTLQFENGESLDMPDGYILDVCSMPFAISLAQGRGLEEQTIYAVDAKQKRIRGYNVASSENEIVETPLGEMDTIKVVLQRELRPDRTLTFWLSTKHQYIPVKVENKRKSRTITMLVSEMSLL